MAISKDKRNKTKGEDGRGSNVRKVSYEMESASEGELPILCTVGVSPSMVKGSRPRPNLQGAVYNERSIGRWVFGAARTSGVGRRCLGDLRAWAAAETGLDQAF